MKILITTDWYLPAVNGVVTSVLNLKKQLSALGNEVRVLTLSNDIHSYVKEDVTYIGSVSAERIYPGARVRSHVAGKAVQELIEWRPDIVHSQCEFSTFHFAKKIAGACNALLIHTYHTVYENYTHYFSLNRRLGRWVVKEFSRKILDNTDLVIAPTEKVRKLLYEYEISSPVSVIPTGIDLTRFQAAPDPNWLNKQKNRLGIPTENKILIYVGRLAKEKNIEELFECRSMLSQKCNIPVTLLLVGDGPWRTELENLAEKLNLKPGKDIVFTGMIPAEEVAAYYHLGDIFVSASTSETQGLTYVEALASGLPTLCHEDACLNDVVSDGVNGWQYRTVSEFTEYAEAVLSDTELLHRFASNAAHSAEKFSTAKFADGMLSQYSAALSARSRANTAAGRKA